MMREMAIDLVDEYMRMSPTVPRSRESLIKEALNLSKIGYVHSDLHTHIWHEIYNRARNSALAYPLSYALIFWLGQDGSEGLKHGTTKKWMAALRAAVTAIDNQGSDEDGARPPQAEQITTLISSEASRNRIVSGDDFGLSDSAGKDKDNDDVSDEPGPEQEQEVVATAGAAQENINFEYDEEDNRKRPDLESPLPSRRITKRSKPKGVDDVDEDEGEDVGTGGEMSFGADDYEVDAPEAPAWVSLFGPIKIWDVEGAGHLNTIEFGTMQLPRLGFHDGESYEGPQRTVAKLSVSGASAEDEHAVVVTNCLVLKEPRTLVVRLCFVERLCFPNRDQDAGYVGRDPEVGYISFKTQCRHEEDQLKFSGMPSVLLTHI